ncbi:apolipoprotein L3-like [Anomaloglossus baeobatrachus]
MADDQENNLELLDVSVEELRGILTCLLKNVSDCSKQLLTSADDLDEFHRAATIASVTGSSVGLAGGITTIVGLVLAPFTAGVSLIVSGIGAGVAAVGGLTGASASIADTVNMKKKCSRVEKIVKKVNINMNELEKISKKLDLLVTGIMSKQKAVDGSDAARVGGRGVYAAIEVGRMIQLGKVSAAAARGVKGAKEIHEGCKTEEAAQIRECAEEIIKLHKDLQKLDEDLVPHHYGAASGCN